MTEFFTVQEAAKILRCHKRTIMSYIQDRTIIASFVGEKWIIPREQVVKLLNANANTLREPFSA